jgi:TonB family protein
VFRTLLASRAPRQPMTQPAIVAGILHLIVVVGALRLTAATPSAHSVAPRNTIPFQLALPRDPSPSVDGPPRAPVAPAPLPLMEPSPPLRLDLASPYSPADWNGLTRASIAGQPTRLPALPDSAASPLSSAEVDEFPELRGTLNPLYPERLSRAGVAGSVRVEYVVLLSGRVDSASVRVIASTEPAFTTSVISALLSASFKPARRRGRPVAVLVQQTIRFQNR